MDVKRNRIRFIYASVILGVLMMLSMQTVKAEGYTPGMITGEAGGRPVENNSSGSTNNGGGSYVPEVDKYLGVPKTEVIDSEIVYNKPGNQLGHISCSSGTQSVPMLSPDSLSTSTDAKIQFGIKYNRVLSDIKSLGILGGNTVATTEQLVCYQGTNISTDKGIDKNRAYAQWKWTIEEAFNGEGNPVFPKDQLLFGTPYTHFGGYSVESVQQLIDEGWFDSWLDKDDKRPLEEKRKDLNASNIKGAHYDPKDYPSELIGWENSWTSQWSAMMNFDKWYKMTAYIKQYYYYQVNGTIKYNLEGYKFLDLKETDYRVSDSSTVSRKEPVYDWVNRYVSYQKGTNYPCRDEIANASNKCETRLEKKWEKVGEKTFYKTPRYLKYKLGTYYVNISHTDYSNETTDWQYKTHVIDYIDIYDNPIPEPEKHVCDYVPYVTGKGCRILYRDDVMDKRYMITDKITKEQALESCKCIGVSNLTD